MTRARTFLRCVVAMTLVGGLTLAAAPHSGTQDVPPDRLAAREWFRDAKLGMFVHWGVYSQLGQGEWVMQNRALQVNTDAAGPRVAMELENRNQVLTHATDEAAARRKR